MFELVRYRNVVFDSARWDGFPFRPDDIVISTPPKCGTTWMQSLCAMLVLDTVELDRPLSQISFQHHWSNLDPAAFMGGARRRRRPRRPGGAAAAARPPGRPGGPLPLVDGRRAEHVHRAVAARRPPPHRHLRQRRSHADVELFHYSDLLVDLPGQLRRLAALLGIERAPDQLDRIVAAAAFGVMKARADDFVPDAANHIWRSNEEFFHRGVDGQWRDLLEAADLVHYERRVADLVAPEVAVWAHGGWSGARALTGAGT
jgi:hypothetical protein